MSNTSATERSASYTSVSLGPIQRLKEFWALRKTSDPKPFIQRTVAQVKGALDEIAELTGTPSIDRDILEVGTGQNQIQLAYLSLQNRAIGIDSESPAPRGFDIPGFVKLLREHGLIRFTKTTIRAVTGHDRRVQRSYVREVGTEGWPTLDHRKMDAENLSFDANTFDIIFSRAVFEHISDPGSALAELSRVLRPGGVFYCLFHLYTSDSGCHDIRIFRKSKDRPPYWGHLQTDTKHLVAENTYLNKIRINQWHEIIQKEMPGAVVTAMNDAPANEKQELEKLRAQGKLQEYTDEELLSPTVKVIWQKPAESE